MSNFFTTRLAEKRAILAPMAGFSDAPFRRLCREFGSAWAVTEMVSAKGLVQGNQQGIEIGAPYPNEPDLVIQIFGFEPDVTAQAGFMLQEKYSPVALDLNMGCPVKKIINKGCGSELMRDPNHAHDIIKALVDAVDVPVSAKMRLGIDHINVLEVAQAVAEAGAGAIAIHGRTAKQKYSGEADWDTILEVAKSIDAPIIGSGDICTKEQVDYFHSLGLGVMIARGSLGRPWIFSEIRGEAAPSQVEILQLTYWHCHLNCDWYGERSGMLQMRGQLAKYLADFANAAELRPLLTKVETLEDVATIWLEHFGLDIKQMNDDTNVVFSA